VVRRFVTLTLSFGLVLGVGILQVHSSFGQGEAKKDAQPPKSEPPKKEAVKEAPKTDTAKSDTAKSAEAPTKEAPKPSEPPLPPIPPEVQAKLEAARKAVAEAVVAAQDAGLIETSIDPPPILDILITGRATDARTLKNTAAKKPYGVSPEVMCAWFTGYGKLEGVDYVHDVRIINPSAGLKQWYDQRAAILRQYIEEVRKAKGPAPAPKAEAAKTGDTKKAEEYKKPEPAKKSDEAKKP
jgi:hypothetical protein